MNRRLIGLLVAGLLALGACGGDDGSGSSPAADSDPGQPASDVRQLVLASAGKATEAGTARFEFTMTLAGPETVNLVATGASDSSVPVMSMEMDMASLIPGTPAGGATVATVFDGSAVYMRFPGEMAAGLPDGKRWVRLDLASISSQAGIDPEALAAQFNSSDPLANISLLTGATDDVTEVGTEEVRGVPTRHLKMTVDLERASEQLSSLSGPNGERLKEAVAQAAATVGVTQLPMEAWIDDDGLPRRLLYTLDLAQAKVPGAEGAATGTATIKMEFFDFGEDVEVTIPSVEETLDFSELLGSF